jgi:hypothetical protein
MAVVSFSDCYQRVRVKLSDTEVPTGQVFTDSFLEPLMVEAWAGFVAAQAKWSLPYTEKESFVYVQPYQDYIDVAQSGLPNPKQLIEVWSCGEPSLLVELPQSPAPSNDPTTGDVRVVPQDISGFSTGDKVGIYMDPRFYGGGVNDEWSVRVDSPYLVLLGCKAPIKDPSDYGTLVPGYVFKASSNSWYPLTYQPEDSPADWNATGGRSQLWTYRGQAIRLSPRRESAQILSVIYRISGDSTFVTSDSPVLEDDAANFLTEYLCGVAAQSKGQPGWQSFMLKAVGNEMGLADGNGGLLGEFIAGKVKEMQMTPQFKSRFRVKNYQQLVSRSWLRRGNVVS